MIGYNLIMLCISIFIGACAYETKKMKKESEAIRSLYREINDPVLKNYVNVLSTF